MIAERVLSFLPAFGAGVGFLLALAALLDFQDWNRRLVLAGLYCTVAVLILHGHLFHERSLVHAAWFFRLQIPSAFLLGPVLWLHVNMRLDPDVELRRVDALHFLPAALAALWLLPWSVASAADQSRILEAAFARPADDPGIRLFIAGVLISNVYVLLALVRLWPLVRRKGPHRLGALLLFLTLLAGPGFTILVALGIVLNNPALARAQLIGTTMLLIAFFLIRQRRADFFLEMSRADRRERYSNPQLALEAVEQLDRRIARLVAEDVFFREPDLSLPDLSRQVEVTPHQLSEYLNLHRHTSFRGFVNQLRVDAARRLLETDPERTVLSIAFEVGFQSKSAFNRVFREVTGRTPSSLRR